MSDQDVSVVPDWKRSAQSLIAEVYADIQRRSPDAIVLSSTEYRLLQKYRASLGELDAPTMDYLGKYQLFGIEIRIGTRDQEGV